MVGNGNRDYYHVDVPDQTPPDEYEWWERRAEILNLILERGSPHGITQNRLAERYDVSKSQISKDMDRLRGHVEKHLGRSAKMTTRALYAKTIEDLREQGEYREAFEVAMEWNRWLQDLGKQETTPEKHEISGRVESEHTEKKMLVGVDLGSFPEVDQSRMVGVDMREDATDIAVEHTDNDGVTTGDAE
jgi:DNA-binding Lrp family transcriptional regulator